MGSSALPKRSRGNAFTREEENGPMTNMRDTLMRELVPRPESLAFNVAPGE
jgi:hypothetical protein